MKNFTKELWYGSYYEIAMEFYPKGDVDRIISALKVLLNDLRVDCQWADQEFTEYKHIPNEIDEDTFTSFFGTIRLNDGNDIGCHIVIIRELDRSNWLDICIPSGMLEESHGLKYPIEHKNNKFLYDIDNLFIDLARKIYNVAQFDLATIGEEVSGINYITNLTKEDLIKGGIILPKKYMNNQFIDLNKNQIQEDLYFFSSIF